VPQIECETVVIVDEEIHQKAGSCTLRSAENKRHCRYVKQKQSKAFFAFGASVTA
jgi:hypothetical protein